MRVCLSDVRNALVLRPPAPVADEVSSRAAVALILRQETAGIEVLFIRRAEHEDDPWSGHVGFPGGRAEPGDPDLLTTARRETAEEIGIDLDQDAELLGGLDHLRAMAGGRLVDLAIAPFVFRLRRPVAERLSPEVTSVHWLSLDALLGPEARGRFEYRHGDQPVELPCLRLDGLLIWGLTYRMFAGLHERLKEAEGRNAAHASS